MHACIPGKSNLNERENVMDRTVVYRKKEYEGDTEIYETEDGTLQFWNTDAGILARWKVKNEKEAGHVVRIDGNLYAIPINIGYGFYLFTEYWEGTLPTELISVPVRITPTKIISRTLKESNNSTVRLSI